MYGSTIERSSIGTWTNCRICGVAVLTVDADEHAQHCKQDWEHRVAERTRQAINMGQDPLDWFDHASVELDYDAGYWSPVPPHYSMTRVPLGGSDASLSDKFVRVSHRYHPREGILEHAPPQPPSLSTKSPNVVMQSDASRLSRAYATVDDDD
eukprot:COSAG02_NODE_1760_length_11035_cov_7.151426_2_plen_153_part_00